LPVVVVVTVGCGSSALSTSLWFLMALPAGVGEASALDMVEVQDVRVVVVATVVRVVVLSVMEAAAEAVDILVVVGVVVAVLVHVTVLDVAGMVDVKVAVEVEVAAAVCKVEVRVVLKLWAGTTTAAPTATSAPRCAAGSSAPRQEASSPRVAVSPRPSCPWVFRPQHFESPLLKMAQLCAPPQLTARTSSARPRSTGGRRSPISPRAPPR